MTEKQPPLPIRSPVAPPSDKTAVDGTRVSSKAQAEPNPPEFDPSKFGVIPIDPEVRKDILEKKLQRLGPEFFRDTLPPNQPLTAPAGAVGASPVAPSLVPTAVSPDLVTTQLTARSLAARRRRQSLMLVGPLVVGASLLLLFAVLKVAGRVGRPPGASEVHVTEIGTDSPQATVAAPSVVAPERAAPTSLEPVAIPSAVARAVSAPHSSAAPPNVVMPRAKSNPTSLKPGSNATSKAPPRAPEARDSKPKEFDPEAPLYPVGPE